MRIAIIGGGFAGVSMTLQALRRDVDVVLIAAPPLLGRGVAYGAAHPAHLLNVPADRMGLDPAAPGDFADWLDLRDDARTTYVPRLDYGRYLQHRLHEAVAGAGARLTVIPTTAMALSPAGVDQWRITMADGATLPADAVVLALGAPAALRHLAPPHPGVVPDPWAPGAFDAIPADAAVLVVGTGLTMADVVIALDEAGHVGPVTALSRRGLLPRVHPRGGVHAHPHPPDLASALQHGRLAAALHRFRELVAHGVAPEDLIDPLRPLTPALWRSWTPTVKRRFLRHLRPWWDTLRHRIPDEVWLRLQERARDGRFEVIAGRLHGLHHDGDRLRAHVRPRGSAAEACRHVDRVVLATGLDAELAHTDSALLADLHRQGLAASDATGLGLACTDRGQLLDARGQPVPGVHVLGALRRGESWESTAVAELRSQAAALAATLPGAR